MRRPVVLLAAALAASAAAAQDKPYRVENGRADARTAAGYSAFIANCSACHGPDARGTPAAPDMLPGVKAMAPEAFARLLGDGRKGRDANGAPREMPGFAQDPEVAPRIGALYAYLRARADGALGPGRPRTLE